LRGVFGSADAVDAADVPPVRFAISWPVHPMISPALFICQVNGPFGFKHCRGFVISLIAFDLEDIVTLCHSKKTVSSAASVKLPAMAQHHRRSSRFKINLYEQA
jgi:hypothetical protein